LRIGDSDPAQSAEAAAIGADHGVDEINLNVGCPSSRVASGTFGACLMREPRLVGDCIAAMKAKVEIPATIKCHMGVDEQDPETALGQMGEHVLAAGCDRLIVHALREPCANSPRKSLSTFAEFARALSARTESFKR